MSPKPRSGAAGDDKARRHAASARSAGAGSRSTSPEGGNPGDNTDWSALANLPDKSKGKVHRPRLTVNLFWRSFGLISLLLAMVLGMWYWAISRQSEQGTLAGQQLVSTLRLTRALILETPPTRQAAVLKSLEDQEGLALRQRTPANQITPWPNSLHVQALVRTLNEQLREDVIVASAVDGVPGLWIGWTVGSGQYWFQADPSRLGMASPLGWPWLVGLVIITAGLSAGFVRLINRPLKDLSFAASRIGEGEYDSHLDESNMTNEIRMVNMGFNRMARELAKVEEERAVMLAGISHDLRTPLARLRLEAEISVADEEARRNMASDIDQLDAIIDKFMDYARPEGTHVVPVNVSAVVEREANAFRDKSQIRIESRLPPNLMVKGDDTELGRVFANLFENARRYGRSIDTGIARVKVSHVLAGDSLIITVRDYGQGVAPEKLSHLTTPFFRGDAARTAATGAGLGLAVVKKALQRIDASLELNNAAEKTGLVAHIRLKRSLMPSNVGGSHNT
ncbi:MAG: hypothetical protein RLZZ494_1998 [Pseudomonadota bacterium]